MADYYCEYYGPYQQHDPNDECCDAGANTTTTTTTTILTTNHSTQSSFSNDHDRPHQHHNTNVAGLSGGNSPILLPLSHHARKTLLSLGRLHPHSILKVSPFCHEHPEGAHEVRGWCLDTPGSARSSCLPINCSMFDGVSVVKCQCTEGEILELLSNAQDTRRRLGDAISRIMKATMMEETKHLRASWKRCRPTINGIPQSLCSALVSITGPNNPTSNTSTNEGGIRVSFYNDAQECVPLIDSEYWIPELSPEGFIGLYHHWTDHDGPSLYMVCQSYLPKACLEFADMVRNLGDECSASDIFHSEETHWLRQACSRNRARLIATVCQQMNIRFPAMLDYNACKSSSDSRDLLLAISMVETLHHDIQCIPIITNRNHHPTSNQEHHENELIRILNFCTSSCNLFSSTSSTTTSNHNNYCNNINSTVCIMAPWDGIWMFNHQHNDNPPIFLHNPKTHSNSYSSFFPTITPQITEQDHSTLKKKKMSFSSRHSSGGHHDNHHYSAASMFMFSTNIPETSEILNIFNLKKEKKKSGSRRKSSKSTEKEKSIIIRNSASQKKDVNLLAATAEILSSMDEMQVVMPLMEHQQDLDTFKQMIFVEKSNHMSSSSGIEEADANCNNNNNNDDYDADVMRAYQRSISKMTSLVIGSIGGHNNRDPSTGNDSNSANVDDTVKCSKKKTYLRFNESVLYAMEQQGWKRSKQQYNVLIPLACGLCQNWKQTFQEMPLMEEGKDDHHLSMDIPGVPFTG